MLFHLIFGFLVFKVVQKQTMNLFKGREDLGFSIFGVFENYKPALSKSDSFWDSSYCLIHNCLIHIAILHTYLRTYTHTYIDT